MEEKPKKTLATFQLMANWPLVDDLYEMTNSIVRKWVRDFVISNTHLVSEDVNDIVSEFYEKMVAKQEKMRLQLSADKVRGGFLAFLRLIVKRHCIDYSRKASRRVYCILLSEFDNSDFIRAGQNTEPEFNRKLDVFTILKIEPSSDLGKIFQEILDGVSLKTISKRLHISVEDLKLVLADCLKLLYPTQYKKFVEQVRSGTLK